MASTLSWIQAFLNARGLRTPDGRHFFRYRCSDAEYLDLRARLADDLRATSIASQPTTFFAGFVVYASEWYRREFCGGSWNWRDIVQSIGGTEAELRPNFYDGAEKALRFWERPLITWTGRHEFLGTVVREAGLPLGLIGSDEESRRKITRFVSELLETSLLEPAADLGNFARSRKKALPQILQDDAILENMCDLARLLGGWRDKIRSDLDLVLVDPTFREALPFELDEDTGRQVARALLDEARRVVERTDIGAPVFSMRLRYRNDSWTIEGEIRLPRRATAQSLGLPNLSGHPRGRLYAAGESVDRVILTDFYANEDGVLELSRPGARVELPANMLSGSIDVYAAAAGAELDRVSLVSLSDLPWSFREEQKEQGEWSFVGDGSRRTTRSRMLVLAPPNVEVQPVEAARELARGLVGGRTLFEVTGATVFRNETDTCRIATGATHDDLAQYLVSGVRSSLGSGRAFEGQPEIIRVDTKRQREKSVLWRLDGFGAPLRLLDSSCFGNGWLVVVSDDGETRFRQHVVILPAGVQIHGSAPRGGLPRLIVDGLREASNLSIEYAGRAIENGPQWVVPDLPGSAGDTLTLRVRWRDGGEAAIPVRHPGRVGHFLGPDDAPLEEGAPIALDRLHRVRAEVLDTTDATARFEIHASLQPDLADGALDGDDAVITWQSSFELPPKGNDGRHVLDLSAAEEELALVFASVPDHEFAVRLDIRERIGRPLRGAKLLVTRYDGAIARSGATLLVPDCKPTLALRTQPLDAPSTPPIELKQVSPGQWSIDDVRLAPGPWLVTAWDGPVCRHRPLLVTRPGVVSVERAPRPSGLAEAIRMRTPERQVRIPQVLSEMSEDSEHPDWPLVFEFLEALDAVPPQTFDVIVDMTKQPTLCAVTFLRLHDAQQWMFMEALERLPYMWHLVPMLSWERALLVDARRVAGERARRSAMLKAAGLEEASAAAPEKERYLELHRQLLAGRNKGVANALRRALIEIGYRDPDRADRVGNLEQARGAYSHFLGIEGFEVPSDLGLKVPSLGSHAPSLAEVLEVPEDVERRGWADRRDFRGLYLAPRIAAVYALLGRTPVAGQVLALRRARGSDPLQNAYFDLVYGLILDAFLADHSPADWSAT